MNKDTIKGNLKQMKGEIKKRWGKLTDDDIDRAEGNMDKISGKLQEKYGYSKEEADRQVRDLNLH